MVKWSFAFVLLSLLTGCVTTPYYGNYVDKDSAIVNQVIANDAVAQLTQLYRPASTRFNLQHATEDPFGVTFIENLRAGGYAISEHKSPAKPVLLKTAGTALVAPEEGAALAYVLDQTSDIYRLSVMVNDQILTRAYKPYKDSIYPAGSWVRKE